MHDFNEIYQSHANQIKSFLICFTSDVELAEELTQETFYQAVKSIHRYNGECKLSVWLCQIAKYTYFNYLKKNKNNIQVSLESIVESKFEFNNKVVSPENIIETRYTIKNIIEEVKLLPSPYSKVFLLRVVQDLSFKEIGQILDKSENWARVTYYRARIKLMERIDIK